MIGRRLVRSLEEDWRDTLDEVARARGWPTSRDVARLATHVAALSEAYNDASRAWGSRSRATCRKGRRPCASSWRPVRCAAGRR